MTVVYRGASVDVNASAPDVTIDPPPGVVDGDYLIAYLITPDSVTLPTYTVPAGWALISQSRFIGRGRVRVLEYEYAGEADFNFSCTSDAQTNKMEGNIIGFANVDIPSSPATASNFDAGPTNSLKARGLTPGVSHRKTVMFVIDADPSLTGPSGWTQVRDSGAFPAGVSIWVKNADEDSSGEETFTQGGSAVFYGSITLGVIAGVEPIIGAWAWVGLI